MINNASNNPQRKEQQKYIHPRNGKYAKRPMGERQRVVFPYGKIFILFLLQLIFFTNAVFGQEQTICDDFYLPFSTFQNRKSFAELITRKLDGFGAFRRAGHKHAGLDIKAGFSELVHPIGKGKVIKIYDQFPHQTVIIEHSFSDGRLFYSSYTHLVDISAKIDDQVDQDTAIGRVFNLDELQKTKFGKNHLHLEIRKTIENYNRISIRCYSMDDLNRNFYDPLTFMEKYLRN
jgi:murein DD-endopeptidase MepM/ murein hydrolase activator NlpD